MLLPPFPGRGLHSLLVFFARHVAAVAPPEAATARVVFKAEIILNKAGVLLYKPDEFVWKRRRGTRYLFWFFFVFFRVKYIFKKLEKAKGNPDVSHHMRSFLCLDCREIKTGLIAPRLSLPALFQGWQQGHRLELPHPLHSHKSVKQNSPVLQPL